MNVLTRIGLTRPHPPSTSGKPNASSGSRRYAKAPLRAWRVTGLGACTRYGSQLAISPQGTAGSGEVQLVVATQGVLFIYKMSYKWHELVLPECKTTKLLLKSSRFGMSRRVPDGKVHVLLWIQRAAIVAHILPSYTDLYWKIQNKVKCSILKYKTVKCQILFTDYLLPVSIWVPPEVLFRNKLLQCSFSYFCCVELRIILNCFAVTFSSRYKWLELHDFITKGKCEQ